MKRFFIIVVLIVFIVSLRFFSLLRYDARPGGDASLAVFWGNEVVATGQLPDIEKSWEFNEQPRDYNRPVLYVFSALPSIFGDVPLVKVITWVSFLGSLALIGLVGLIAYRATNRFDVAILATVISSLANAWYRYIIPVGYHYQNIFGEILVLLFLATMVEIFRTPRRWALYGVGLITFVSTFLFHQLSTFVAVIIACSFMAMTAWVFRRTMLENRRIVVIGLGSAIIVAAAFGMVYGKGLYWELRSFLTDDPTLQSQVPTIAEIVNLVGFGSFFSLFGIAQAFRRPRQMLLYPVAVFYVVILALSFGPLYHFNVPPSRIANYLVTPASILMAVGIFAILKDINRLQGRGTVFVRLVTSVFLIGILVAQAAAFQHYYQLNVRGSAHSSQLTVREERLASCFSKQPLGKALYDYDGYEQGIWLMPLTNRYFYSAVSSIVNTLSPYTDDPSIARKVSNDEKLIRLMYDPNIGDGEFRASMDLFGIRYFVVSRSHQKNIAKRSFLNLACSEGGVSIYRASANASDSS